MTTFIILILASGIGAFAAIFILRLGQPPAVRISLVVLRVLLLTALLMAFIQPSLRFTRVANPDRRTLLLVDNSKSMRLFGAASFLRVVDSIVTTSGIGVRRQCFGDSLRPCDGTRSPSFDDGRSFFPESWGRTGAGAAQRVVLVTDGNWSNTSLPAGLLEEKECWYLRLGEPAHRPFMSVTPVAGHVTSVADSSASLAVMLRGYSSTDGRARIILRERGTTAVNRDVRLSAGFFAETLSMKLPTGRTGRFLAEILAVPHEGAAGKAYAVHSVVPRELSVSFLGDEGRLDSRFLRLACGRNAWKTATNPRAADLLILFAWDSTAASVVARLNPSTALLFLGCLPCPASSVDGGSYSVLRTPLTDPMLLPRGDLPALSTVLRCPGQPLTNAAVHLSITGTAAGRPDTIPLLTSGRFQGRRAVTAAARDLWRWDFWPLAFGADTSAGQPFSTAMLSLLRQRIVADLTGSFLVYPQSVPVYEEAPITLCVSPPPGRDGRTVKITLRHSSGATAFDTAVSIAPGLDSDILVALPGQARGKLALEARLLTPGESERLWRDSIDVAEDDSELRVSAQNTALLQQLARPLSVSDRQALALALSSPPHGNAFTVTRIFNFRQTWQVMCLILALLLAEWLIRRLRGLD